MQPGHFRYALEQRHPLVALRPCSANMHASTSQPPLHTLSGDSDDGGAGVECRYDATTGDLTDFTARGQPPVSVPRKTYSLLSRTRHPQVRSMRDMHEAWQHLKTSLRHAYSAVAAIQ